MKHIKHQPSYIIHRAKRKAFYVENEVKPQEMLLGNGYFAILYPQDGHMPQLCVKRPERVKKVVVKIKL